MKGGRDENPPNHGWCTPSKTAIEGSTRGWVYAIQEWLVGGLEHFVFPYIGKNHSNWLISTPTTLLAINLPQVHSTDTRCFFLVAESTRCVVKTTHPPHCPFYVLNICLNPFNHHFFYWTCTYSLRVLVIKHGNGKPPKEFDDWLIYR